MLQTRFSHSVTPFDLPQPGAVHLWIANIGSGLGLISEETLSMEERSHASRFRFEKHRTRYIFSRRMLREILSGYRGTKPAEIVFEVNEFGKPFLSRKEESPTLFNMSHSESLVIVGVTTDRQIGVDTELVRPMEDSDMIAEEYFTPLELAMIRAADRNLRENAFYACWTRKEAYIKAVGKGLSMALNSFDTSMPLGAGGRRLPLTEDSPDVKEWWLSDLALPQGYAGALVIEGERPSVSHLTWSPQIPPRADLTIAQSVGLGNPPSINSS